MLTLSFLFNKKNPGFFDSTIIPLTFAENFVLTEALPHLLCLTSIVNLFDFY